MDKTRLAPFDAEEANAKVAIAAGDRIELSTGMIVSHKLVKESALGVGGVGHCVARLGRDQSTSSEETSRDGSIDSSISRRQYVSGTSLSTTWPFCQRRGMLEPSDVFLAKKVEIVIVIIIANSSYILP
jgi:hypothetical protein